MKKTIVALATGSLLLGALSCQGRDAATQAYRVYDRSSRSSALQPLEGCDDLLSELRGRTIAQMNETLDQNLEWAVEWGGCGWYWGDPNSDYDGVGSVAEGGGGAPPPSASRDEASQYSETNNQVEGVDEADFIKNDGGHIYILANGHFQIVDAWPPEQANVISRVAIEGTPKKLFVHEGFALIYSSLPPSGQDPYDPWGGSYGGGECTYGYNCEVTGDGLPLKVTVLNISDLSAPRLVRETYVSGSLIAARRIGEAVYTTVIFPEQRVPELVYWPEELYACDQEYDEDEIRRLFEGLRLENTRKIIAAGLEQWLPGVRDVRYVNGAPVEETGLLDSCDNFYASADGDGGAFLTVLGQEVRGFGGIAATTVVGRAGAVYASGRSLYVAARDNSYYSYYDDGAAPESSSVHKFELLSDPYPRSRYIGSGTVKGRVLNQFSMDEHQDHLRIATTSGHVPSPDVHSTVSVLAARGGALEVVGMVDQIAPTEDIRSVRFDGDRGYVVTFKKTDPLFVLDLASPTSPSIVGELHIPGFSTYMHRMDADHLLTIGYDAEEMGDFAYFQGIQLQVFDVSNPALPFLAHKVTIGTRGSTSDATTNHLAFNYFAPLDLLAIPMVICEESSGGGDYGNLMTFSGLMVYDVTAAAGFSYQGGVEHEQAETEDSYSGACNNWWTRSNSLVKRSVIMDEYVFSVTLDEIKIDTLHALGTDVAVVDLRVEAPAP